MALNQRFREQALSKIADKLAKLGIPVMDSNGCFREWDDVVREYNEVMKKVRWNRSDTSI